MLFPAKMKEVCIIGLKDEKDNILETIQDFGFLHPKEINLSLETQQPENGKEISDLSRISKLLEKIESMESKKSGFLESIFGSPAITERIPDRINLKTIDSMEISINKNSDTLKRLEVEIKDLEELNELLLKIKEIKVDFSFLKSSTNTRTIVGEIEIKKVKDLQKILNEFKTAIFEINRFSKDKGCIIIISHFSESNLIKELIQHLLKEYNMDRLIGKPIEQLKEVNKKLNQLKNEYKITLEEFFVKFKEWKRSLTITKGFLTNLKEKKDVQAYLKNTEKTFILCGWAPEKSLNQLTSSLKNYNCWLNFEKVDEAPVLLENPRILKPFESFVKNYGFPQYKSLDPTFILALTLPMFFGFMMSDVIYGICLLTISILLKSLLKNKTTEWVSNIVISFSIFTVLFGILFGSYAGFEFQPVWMSPQQKPTVLLSVALFIGIVHINIGLVFNMINGIKNKDVIIMLDSISWLLIQFSVISSVMKFFGLFEISTTLLILTLIFGSGIRFFIKKFIGILDIPGFFGNVFSYARLMVIALASIYIAYMINFSMKMLWGIFIPLAIIIFVFGHTFNFLLNTLGASINSLRLHYIEFFGRFFDGNGIEYKPFRKNLSVEVI
jgi:V/A-type H+-transporting ATPase subunit I